jgi:hypothetical protein
MVRVKDLETLTKRYPEASKKARISRLHEAVALLEAAVKKKTPYGAGPIHLRDTVFGTVKELGQKITGIVGTPAKYGEAVECGTKPHFPPIDPLEFWVEKKLGLSGREARSVAFLIARAISVRGTKAAHMFEKGFGENEARVVRILNEIADDIARMV